MDPYQVDRDTISWVSHQIRTPLSVLGNLATLLSEREFEPARRKEMLELICDEARRLELLIGNVIGLLRLICGEIRLEPSRSDLPSLVDEAMRRALVDTDKAGRQIAAGLTVYGDRELLTQLVEGVLRALVEYATGDSSVAVEASETPDAIVIRVTGDGPPIDDAPALFKLGGVSGERQGNLDLVIAKAVSSAHGGTISASMTQDRRVEFLISLPMEGR